MVLVSIICIPMESAMQIKDSVALVTGANRGIGRAFIEALLERGARRIYAAARDLASLDAVVRLDPKRIRALKLDVTSAEDARAAAAEAKDLTLLINNAAVLSTGGLTDIPVDAVRGNMETNFFGLLNVITAFVPVLERSEGGIVNILTLLSLVSIPASPPTMPPRPRGGRSRSRSARTWPSAGSGCTASSRVSWTRTWRAHSRTRKSQRSEWLVPRSPASKRMRKTSIRTPWRSRCMMPGGRITRRWIANSRPSDRTRKLRSWEGRSSFVAVAFFEGRITPRGRPCLRGVADSRCRTSRRQRIRLTLVSNGLKYLMKLNP